MWPQAGPAFFTFNTFSSPAGREAQAKRKKICIPAQRQHDGCNPGARRGSVESSGDEQSHPDPDVTRHSQGQATHASRIRSCCVMRPYTHLGVASNPFSAGKNSPARGNLSLRVVELVVTCHYSVSALSNISGLRPRLSHICAPVKTIFLSANPST